MTVYNLSERNVDRWRAWFELNGIAAKNVVRGKQLVIDDADIHVVEFFTDDEGHRARHVCDCEEAGMHYAKRLGHYPLVNAPGDWADADRMSA